LQYHTKPGREPGFFYRVSSPSCSASTSICFESLYNPASNSDLVCMTKIFLDMNNFERQPATNRARMVAVAAPMLPYMGISGMSRITLSSAPASVE